jgi:glucose/arabinose dehydrogenase
VPSGIPISGHERLAWEQPASSADELARLGFRAYVDGVPVELTGVSCAARPTSGAFACASRLPALASGSHAIQVAAYVRGPARVEGLPSAPLYVTSVEPPERDRDMDVSGAPAPPTEAILRATVVADGLLDPTDLAVLPDGRVLVAERRGRVRVVGAEGLLPEPAVSLDDVVTGGGRGLLAIAVDRSFEKSRAVFVLYTTDSGLRLARFTVSGDTLYARATLLDGLPISRVDPAAVLRAGPDGRLYVALDDAGQPETLPDLGSYSGKILRFNPDGTTPDDRPGRSPVYAIGVQRPVGLGWTADGSTLRLVGVDASPAGRSMSLSVDAAPDTVERIVAVTRFTLSADAGASSATTYTSARIASLDDDLLVASTTMRSVLRMSFTSPLVPDGSDWILSDETGPITALVVSPDGTIYAATTETLLRLDYPDFGGLR